MTNQILKKKIEKDKKILIFLFLSLDLYTNVVYNIDS